MSEPREAMGDDRLVDWAQVRRALAFGARSVWRHRWVVLITVSAMTAAAAGMWTALPRTYRARAVIQMTPNPAAQAMVNPRRYFGRDVSASGETALRAAKSQQFLLELIDRHQLVSHWEQHRSAAQRWRDALMHRVKRAPTAAEARLMLLGTLEDRLSVTWRDGGTADISIGWPEPGMARTLVEEVQRRFLEVRREQQTQAARTAIGLLEKSVAAAAGEVEGAVASVEARRVQLRGRSKPSTVRGLQAQGSWGKMPDEQLVQLRSQILSRRHTLSVLQAQRSTKIAATEAEVAELAGRYGAQHPTRVGAERTLESLRQESPEAIALREEEARLLGEFVALGGKELDLVDPVLRATPTTELEESDPRLFNARDTLRLTTARFADLTDRLQTARLELATAESTFEEGFAVVRVPTVPLRAESPRLRKVLAAGFAAGVLLALFLALWLDLRRGVLFERWQIEDEVGAPILADVSRR